MSEPSYQRLRDGTPTTGNDRERGVWYAANGKCGYWTDDWSKLKTTIIGTIPCCPHCGCVGMNTTFADWIDGAEKFEKDGHPWYRKFLQEEKEQCRMRVEPRTQFLERYELWRQSKGL